MPSLQRYDGVILLLEMQLKSFSLHNLLGNSLVRLIWLNKITLFQRNTDEINTSFTLNDLQVWPISMISDANFSGETAYNLWLFTSFAPICINTESGLSSFNMGKTWCPNHFVIALSKFLLQHEYLPWSS